MYEVPTSAAKARAVAYISRELYWLAPTHENTWNGQQTVTAEMACAAETPEWRAAVQGAEDLVERYILARKSDAED